jgi:hypothetical protein
MLAQTEIEHRAGVAAIALATSAPNTIVAL